MKIPELLAPVGSSEHLKTVILAGASSIYLSGKEFGARKYAENFNIAEIREAVKFAHLYNVKVYVTVNTLIKENELSKVSKYLLDLYEIGVDAVLVQDIGLVNIINENIPKLTIHASTQMNIHNKDGIDWAKKHNIKRIVLPRETEMHELKELIKYAHSQNIEIEIFAHGALCYSYSGHCLLSSFQGGRSGNRGTCAQPCRETYELILRNEDENNKSRYNKSMKEKSINPKKEGKYLLSPRDLSLYENLGEIINLDVDSIKIEGRMRSKDYVFTIVNNYRKRLNELKHDKQSKILNQNIKNSEKRSKNKKSKNYNKKKQEDIQLINELKNQEKIKNKVSIEELELVFNREFTSGHLIPKNHQNIINRKKPGHSGLYIGNIYRYNEQTQEIIISLHNDLITIPEKGDGILIELDSENTKKTENKSFDKKSKKDKFNKKSSRRNKKEKETENNSEIYGFDISSKPTIKDPKDKHWRKRDRDKNIKNKLLVIKKVRENKRVPVEIEKGNKVFLTKRNSLNKNIKDLMNDKSKQSFKKSVLELYFRIDENNCPHLKGNLKLDNKQVITTKIKGEKWEEAIKKPVTGETIEKQLSKIGDLPYYIKNIKINLNSKRLFTPISSINELRREFFEKLEEEIINYYKPRSEDLKEAKLNIKNFNNDLDKLKLKSNKKVNEVNNVETDDKYKEGKNIGKENKENLAIYLNNLDALIDLNENNTVKDGTIIFNKVYLEIPNEKQIYETAKEKLNNTNPLKSKKINISYCVNFLKEAINLSVGQDYKLIWKLPDIISDENKESIIQILGILNKMDLSIDIMTSLIGLEDSLNDKFNIKIYGNYPLNVYNTKSIIELNKYESISLSPELYKGNIKKLLDDYNSIRINQDNLPEIELLVHGNIESMISRKEIISKKQLKLIEKTISKNKKNSDNYYEENNNLFIKNRKGEYYPIKSDIIEDNITILNSKELCLIDEILYLKSIGLNNFAIDGRWKSKYYINTVSKTYREALSNESENKVEKYLRTMQKLSKDTTKGNFNTGLK